jgi:hypothetical protein
MPEEAAMIAVSVLGLVAAFLFALSAFIQERAARRVMGTHTASMRDASAVKRLLGRLVRSRSWLVGWLTNLSGVGTQAVALKVGSVATVQPLMSAQLLFVLGMAAAEQRRWPSLRDWLSVFAVCAGLVLLVTAYGAAPLTGQPHRHRVLLAMACAVTLIVVLRQLSRHSRPRAASLLVGVAAGLCHALNAVCLKLTVEDVYHGGVASALLDWSLYALAATAVSGMLLGQIAFASGPLPPAIAAMSVTNPVASFLLGIFAFDTPLPRDLGVLTAISLAGGLIAVGVVGVANASITRHLFGADSAAELLVPAAARSG